MRIGIINEYYPPYAPGGAEYSTAILAEALARSGHGVFVITPHYGGRRREEKEGYTIIRYPFPVKLREGMRAVPLKWHANGLFYAWSFIVVCWALFRYRLQILHIQNKFSLVGAVWAGRILNIPTVYTIRDTSLICTLAICLHSHNAVPAQCSLRYLLSECSGKYIDSYLTTKTALARFRQKIFLAILYMDTCFRRTHLRYVDGVIAASRGILDVYESSGILQRKRVRVVYHLPSPEVSFSHDELVSARARWGIGKGAIVLYAGKFSRGKGLYDLISASQILASSNPNAIVVLAGKGVVKDVPANTRVMGELTHGDMLRLYALADIVVVPSVCHESLSRVLFEAMAAGKAVIATDIGGNAELVKDGVNGLLVPRGEPRKLAQAIKKLLEEPDTRKAMGEASRTLVRKCFSEESILRDITGFYGQLKESLQRRRL